MYGLVWSGWLVWHGLDLYPGVLRNQNTICYYYFYYLVANIIVPLGTIEKVDKWIFSGRLVVVVGFSARYVLWLRYSFSCHSIISILFENHWNIECIFKNIFAHNVVDGLTKQLCNWGRFGLYGTCDLIGFSCFLVMKDVPSLFLGFEGSWTLVIHVILMESVNDWQCTFCSFSLRKASDGICIYFQSGTLGESSEDAYLYMEWSAECHGLHSTRTMILRKSESLLSTNQYNIVIVSGKGNL